MGAETVKSVVGVTTLSSNNCLAPPGHGLDQTPDGLLWDGVPLLLQCLEQISEILWSFFAPVHLIPQMLNRR